MKVLLDSESIEFGQICAGNICGVSLKTQFKTGIRQVAKR